MYQTALESYITDQSTYESLNVNTKSQMLGPERVVSCHTALKTCKRASSSRECLNARIRLCLNTDGTASYDPLPAVIKFLKTKERRYKVPDTETYCDRFFIDKFFAKERCVV